MSAGRTHTHSATTVLLLALLALVLSGATAAVAQPADSDSERLRNSLRIEVERSPDSLTVGDPLLVRVRMRTDAQTQVVFASEPKLGSEAQLLEFRQQAPAAVQGADQQIWSATYHLALYVVGEHMLPPFRAQVKRGAVTAEVQSDSVFVFVASVLDDSLAAAGLVDIKEQRELTVPLPLWAWIVLAAVLVGALGAWLWWRQRNRQPQPKVVAPPKPPHEVALQALRQLETKRLPLDGKFKEHYVQLSEILRAYLEDAPLFGIPALEETTDEIVQSLKDRGTASERVQHVQALCEEADLVKFAKHQPPVDECMRAIERVADFVRQTARQPSAPVASAQKDTVLAALDEATHDAGASTPGARS
jgi:hypothetical protein